MTCIERYLEFTDENNPDDYRNPNIIDPCYYRHGTRPYKIRTSDNPVYTPMSTFRGLMEKRIQIRQEELAKQQPRRRRRRGPNRGRKQSRVAVPDVPRTRMTHAERANEFMDELGLNEVIESCILLTTHKLNQQKESYYRHEFNPQLIVNELLGKKTDNPEDPINDKVDNLIIIL